MAELKNIEVRGASASTNLKTSIGYSAHKIGRESLAFQGQVIELGLRYDLCGRASGALCRVAERLCPPVPDMIAET